MTDELKYPSINATISVLKKLSITPSTRINEYDQDFEYTSCRIEEIDDYLALYQKNDTSDQEKRVLGCFLLECHNEYIGSNNSTHYAFNQVMNLLHHDIEIHETELAYWGNTEDPNKEHWWAITRFILEWENNHK